MYVHSYFFMYRVPACTLAATRLNLTYQPSTKQTTRKAHRTRTRLSSVPPNREIFGKAHDNRGLSPARHPPRSQHPTPNARVHAYYFVLSYDRKQKSTYASVNVCDAPPVLCCLRNFCSGRAPNKTGREDRIAYVCMYVCSSSRPVSKKRKPVHP